MIIRSVTEEGVETEYGDQVRFTWFATSLYSEATQYYYYTCHFYSLQSGLLSEPCQNIQVMMLSRGQQQKTDLKQLASFKSPRKG